MNTKSKLIWNAVPTLFDVPNPPARTPSRPLIKRSTVNKRTRVKLEGRTLASQPTNSNPTMPTASCAAKECETPQNKKLKRDVQKLRKNYGEKRIRIN